MTHREAFPIDVIVYHNPDDHVLTGFHPVSVRAKAWFDNRPEANAFEWLGAVAWVNQRMAEKLATALVAAGFDVEEA